MNDKDSHQKDGEDASRLFSKMDIWSSEKAGFHVPGHCGGRFFSDEDRQYLIQTDTTELSATDDFFSPQNQIKCALNDTAEIFGSAYSFYIASGSTTGIRVMLASIIDENTHLLLSRQVHLSVLTAISLLGCAYSFIETKNNDMDYSARLWLQPDPEDVKNAIEKDRSITDILLTSPNYYGDCASLKEIAEVAHRYDCRLLVDEAHGAHFYFADATFPQAALVAGADICVQSTHKTLPALTMASLIHISKEAVSNRRICPDKMRYALRLFETSSPSFVIGASNYMAIKRMSQSGVAIFSESARHIRQMLVRFRQIEGLDIFATDTFSCCDPMRISVSFQRLKYSAISVARALEKMGIYPEYADLQSIVFVFSPFQIENDYDILIKAIEEILQSPGSFALLENIELASMIKSFQEIYRFIPYRSGHVRDVMWLGAKNKNITYKDALGCVNAHVVMLCPPGIPLLWPGEKIESTHIDAIECAILAGLDVYGINEEKISVILNQ